MVDRPRRVTNPRQAAEAAFKSATTKAPEAAPPPRPVIPNSRELVTIRLDSEVLEHFREGGPGWQDRLNAALRAAVGK
jgi:uncharacterized protein (DUF4415 family)